MALSADTKRSPEQKTISSVRDFLVLSGLPMYTDLLLAAGCDSLPSLASMTTVKLHECGIADPLHVDILASAISSTWSTTAPPSLADGLSPTTDVHSV